MIRNGVTAGVVADHVAESRPGAFALMQRQLETALANQEASPSFAYGQRLKAINTINHYTSRA